MLLYCPQDLIACLTNNVQREPKDQPILIDEILELLPRFRGEPIGGDTNEYEECAWDFSYGFIIFLHTVQ